jgi:hypothetical protein
MKRGKIFLRQLGHTVLRLDRNGNKIRFGILSALIIGTAVSAIVSSCKSRYGFTNGKDAAAASSNDVASKTSTTAVSTQTTSMTSSVTTTSTTIAAEPAPATPGGPIVGIDAWQDNKVVASLVTGKPVQFKLTPWSRVTGATTGCDLNRGLVQASWSIGTKASIDIQRYAGQDCRAFDYSGTFTKPGSITVDVDVLSADGQVAHAETTYAVTGDATGGTDTFPTTGSGGAGKPSSPTQSPSQNPTQK